MELVVPWHPTFGPSEFGVRLLRMAGLSSGSQTERSWGLCPRAAEQRSFGDKGCGQRGGRRGQDGGEKAKKEGRKKRRRGL